MYPWIAWNLVADPLGITAVGVLLFFCPMVSKLATQKIRVVKQSKNLDCLSLKMVAQQSSETPLLVFQSLK